MKKMCPLQILLITVTIGLVCGPIDKSCSEKEYKHDGVCCPMCHPGQRVLKHCEKDLGTACNLCEDASYQNSFNGDENCIPCSDCREGMYSIVTCTLKSDTICDCSEGYHCENITSKGCNKCTKHSTCKPRELQIGKGAYRRDTECQPRPRGHNLSKKAPTIPPERTNDDENGQTGHTPGSAPANVQYIIMFFILSLSVCANIVCMIWKREVIIYHLCSGFSTIGACFKQATDDEHRAEAGVQTSVQEQQQGHGEYLAVSIQEQSLHSHSALTKQSHDFAGSNLLTAGKLKEEDAETIPMRSSVKAFHDDAYCSEDPLPHLQ
uniref:tumor necrosis factor receptor superfamily member 5-like n=1 Tax=Pristiophorus japonicus TaxID=55135 RepID=UPI00398E9CB8